LTRRSSAISKPVLEMYVMVRGDPSHIDLTVTSAKAAFEFYDSVFKFLGYVGGRAEGESIGAWMKPGSGFNIDLHEARPEYADVPHNRYAAGLHHLAFVAESREDVDRLHDLLVEIEATVLDPPGVYYDGGYYAVFFADPDGLKLEYVHLP